MARSLRSGIAQAFASALILGLLLHLRYGYSVGDRDHTVLSPRGMQWSNPDWFAGDWIIANAPQPHWFFDVITWFGAETNTLAALYLLHWFAALAAFAAATTLLARAWVPRHAWLAILAVSVLAGVTPIDFLGAGSLWFATPLPNVLGGCLLYVTTAALLIDRHRLAACVGIVTALVHVQHGTVTTVLFAMMAGAVFLRSRRVDWHLLAGAAASLTLVVVALRLRPIAGNMNDFAEACDLVIPYHCEASVWPRTYVLGGVALVALALLTVLYLSKSDRFRWTVVAALPAVGLLGGLAADGWNVPTLGVLAQGLNIYRLMLILVPLTLWGILTPLFAQLTPRQRWLTVGVVSVLGLFALQLGWAVDHYPSVRASMPQLGFGGALVLGCVALTVPNIVRRPDSLLRLAGVGLILSVAGSIIVGQTVVLRSFDARLYPRDEVAAWGDQVQRVVPPGGELLVPPTAYNLRMMTKRAVVVDCKYGPYGGAAWQEFKARMEAVGGFGQCLGKAEATTYADISGDDLAAVAQRYGADYIVIEGLTPPESRNVIESRVASEDVSPVLIPAAHAGALFDQGWTVILRPVEEVPYFLLKAPWRP